MSRASARLSSLPIRRDGGADGRAAPPLRLGGRWVVPNRRAKAACALARPTRWRDADRQAVRYTLLEIARSRGGSGVPMRTAPAVGLPRHATRDQRWDEGALMTAKPA